MRLDGLEKKTPPRSSTKTNWGEPSNALTVYQRKALYAAQLLCLLFAAAELTAAYAVLGTPNEVHSLWLAPIAFAQIAVMCHITAAFEPLEES